MWDTSSPSSLQDVRRLMKLRETAQQLHTKTHIGQSAFTGGGAVRVDIVINLGSGSLWPTPYGVVPFVAMRRKPKER